jgi:hypothetical protein
MGGRHLVDGIPFGRPWLKPPKDRPLVNLPAPKKPRLMYGDSPDPDNWEAILDRGHEGERPLLLENKPNSTSSPQLDTDSSRDSDANVGTSDSAASDSEEDFDVNKDEVREELTALRADNMQLPTESTPNAVSNFASISKSKVKFKAKLDYIRREGSSEPCRNSFTDHEFTRETSEDASDSDSSTSDEGQTGNESDSGSGGDSDSDSDSGSSSSCATDSDSDSDDTSSGPVLRKKNRQHIQPPADVESKPEEFSSKASAQQLIDDFQSSPTETTAKSSRYEKREVSSSNKATAGLTRTQKRNARRRARKAAERSDTAKFDNELLLRKQALLEAMKSPSDITDPRTCAPVSDLDLSMAMELAGAQPLEFGGDSNVSSPNQRRLRLDLNAGRRMLFSALGLRSSTKKPQEDFVQSANQHNIELISKPSLAQDTGINADVGREDPDDGIIVGNWREKINYRAVECCESDIELSEPPFPFVQRWDPQQKGHHGNLGKRKRAQRNQSHFYQDDGRAKKKRSRPRDVPGDSEMGDPTPISNHVDVDEDISELCCNNSQERDDDEMRSLDGEDLPVLPGNLSHLPKLNAGEARTGMIITWKQWLLSKKTDWQPQIADVTAIVTKVDYDTSTVEVFMARRDRNLEENEKVYDDDTGERIYDRFEAPDLEGSDVETSGIADDGHRVLVYGDLIDPRIVQSVDA